MKSDAMRTWFKRHHGLESFQLHRNLEIQDREFDTSLPVRHKIQIRTFSLSEISSLSGVAISAAGNTYEGES